MCKYASINICENISLKNLLIFLSQQGKFCRLVMSLGTDGRISRIASES